MGQHFVVRFTFLGEPFPDPLDFDAWVSTPMWPGNDPSQNMSYSAQAESIKGYVREQMGIHVRKVTHIFRVLAARAMDEMGVDDRVGSFSSGLSASHFQRQRCCIKSHTDLVECFQ